MRWFIDHFIISITLLGVVSFYITRFIVRKVEAAEYRKRRLGELIERFGPDEGLKIFNGNIWQGMTEEQLTESRGLPDDIGDDVHKSTKHIWKYGQYGVNRFAQRITLEDGIVIRWTRQSVEE
jgi:hypothetical protein